MKNRRSLWASILLICLLLTGCEKGTNGTKVQYHDLFDTSDVTELDIAITRDNWDTMVNAPEKKKYVPCDMTLNGVSCAGVGIRPKGNTSLLGVADYNSYRYSYKVEMDHYNEGETLGGLDKLILNNIYEDPSYLAEYLAYCCYEHLEVLTPYYGFANVTINDQPWGLYLTIEAIEDSYAERNDFSSAQIYKPEDSTVEQINPKKNEKDPDGGADLRYRGDSTDNYPNLFDNAVFEPTEEDKQRVVTALEHLYTGENLEEYIDVDECLRYFAALTFTNNPDSYYSPAVCNYYLLENEGVLSMIPWDLNRSFVNYTETDVTYAVNAPIDDPWDCVLGVMTGEISNESERPLFQKLMENPAYQQKYYGYLQELCDWVLDGSFLDELKSIREKITPYVKDDPTRFYTYESYEYAADSLELYIRLRAESVSEQIAGTISTASEGRSFASPLVDGSAAAKARMQR